MAKTRWQLLWLVPVLVMLSLEVPGSVLAQGRSGGGGGGPKPSGADHKARQARPILLGVSGGNAADIANGYCCSGTLGALVQNQSGDQFILSNAHVLVHDMVASSADPDVAAIGNPVNQAGLVDVSCQVRPEDYVANLSTLSSLNPGAGSFVDAAVASVIPGYVSPDGAILQIGTISSTPVAAVLNQAVKKSGRTTGLTGSRVEGLNATVSVGYSMECGGTSFSTTFTGQIIAGNRGSKFIAGGDSGSLMVENVESNPRAIGLLYAGSSTIAVANPIGDVLAYLDFLSEDELPSLGGGFSLVGQPGPAATGELDAQTTRAIQAQERNAARLISVPGATGHAVGVAGNAAVIKVYVETLTDRARQAVPAQLDGVPVVLEATGPIMALGAAGACAPQP
jgi:hypothetical protein